MTCVAIWGCSMVAAAVPVALVAESHAGAWAAVAAMAALGSCILGSVLVELRRAPPAITQRDDLYAKALRELDEEFPQ